jgi:hypothetical protein
VSPVDECAARKQAANDVSIRVVERMRGARSHDGALPRCLHDGVRRRCRLRRCATGNVLARSLLCPGTRGSLVAECAARMRRTTVVWASACCRRRCDAMRCDATMVRSRDASTMASDDDAGYEMRHRQRAGTYSLLCPAHVGHSSMNAQLGCAGPQSCGRRRAADDAPDDDAMRCDATMVRSRDAARWRATTMRATRCATVNVLERTHFCAPAHAGHSSMNAQLGCAGPQSCGETATSSACC